MGPAQQWASTAPSDCKSCRALEKHFDHLHFMCKEVNYNDGEDSHWHDNLIRREL